MDMLKSIFRLAAGVMLGIGGLILLWGITVNVMDRGWKNYRNGRPVTISGPPRLSEIGGAADSATVASLDSIHRLKYLSK